MSARSPEEKRAPAPAKRGPERDRLPYLRLTGVLFAVLAVFGLSVYLMTLVQKAATQVPPSSIPSRLGAAEINRVNQRPFPNDRRGWTSRREKLDRLKRFGWVEPDAGVVHIPIDLAMELVVQRSEGPQSPESLDGGAR